MKGKVRLYHLVPNSHTRQKWATRKEAAKLRASFVRRLTNLIDREEKKSWFVSLPSGWFTKRNSGFQAEIHRLSVSSRKMLRRFARELEHTP